MLLPGILTVTIPILIKFGFGELLFDMLESDIPVIKYENITMPKLPDLTRFKDVTELLLMNVKLSSVHESVGKLDKLTILSLSGNKIEELPREIGMLRNLEVLNLKGNKITTIPEDIRFLDKSNGGNLYRVSLNEGDLSKENLAKLKKLLPEAVISGM